MFWNASPHFFSLLNDEGTPLNFFFHRKDVLEHISMMRERCSTFFLSLKCLGTPLKCFGTYLNDAGTRLHNFLRRSMMQERVSTFFEHLDNQGMLLNGSGMSLIDENISQ
jgi:hypothetical protein